MRQQPHSDCVRHVFKTCEQNYRCPAIGVSKMQFACSLPAIVRKTRFSLLKLNWTTRRCTNVLIMPTKRQRRIAGVRIMSGLHKAYGPEGRFRSLCYKVRHQIEEKQARNVSGCMRVAESVRVCPRGCAYFTSRPSGERRQNSRVANSDSGRDMISFERQTSRPSDSKLGSQPG